MKYFLVLFLFGILTRNALAGVLGNPVIYDLERRLVRLETRQFSESENLEHRMLQLEIQLGTQKGEETLERSPVNPNYYEIIKKETPSEDISFLQRLEKVEKNWEKELEDQLAKFSSKYDSLSERLSTMEERINADVILYKKILSKESEKPENAEGKSDESTSDESTSDKSTSDDPKSEEKPDYEEEPQVGALKTEPPKEFQQIGTKVYYIENNVRKTWTDAFEKCQEINSHLVILQDEEEWSALKEAFEPDHSYWVDINDRSDENRFMSKTTGELAPFLKWDDNEPNSTPGAEDCVELRVDHDYKMNDVSCEAQKYYICEYNDKNAFQF